MTKIKCTTLNSGCDAREYNAPSGKQYQFSLGHFTDVKDPADALHFLNAGAGKYFVAEKPFSEVKKILEDAVKKLLKEKEVDEENPPGETGALEPTAEDIASAGGEIAPLDGEDPAEPEKDPVTEVPGKPEGTPEAEPVAPTIPEGQSVKDNVFTSEGIKNLNAKQQIFLIQSVQGKDATIPRYEKQKIELLLKLQEEGANLLEIRKGYQA